MQIADAWVLKGDVLGYWKYKASEVQRVRVPTLKPLDTIAEAVAVASGLCPPKCW